MSPHAIAALVAALVGLAGCKDSELETNMQSLGAPGLGLAAFSGEDAASSVTNPPETEHVETDVLSSSIPDPEPVAAIPQPASSHELEPCVSIFRLQTCELGVLHHLDSNLNWID